MKTIEEHIKAIQNLFVYRRLIPPTKTCENPAYALVVQFSSGIGSDNMIIDIELWPDKASVELRLGDYISEYSFDQVTILKIEGDEYRSLNVKVEVME